MNRIFIVSLLLLSFVAMLTAQKKTELKSGNPILKGKYADPEAAIFGKRYWIYPTYSDVYEKQLFFDAFSSKDLVNWKTHKNILIASDIKWVKKAMWAPAIVKKDKKYYLFFGANDIH